MTDIEKLIKLLEHAESFSLEAYGKSPNLSECSLNIQCLRACILRAISNAKALRERLAQEPVLQDIEQYRMQMASISTAAIGYWKEGDGIHPDYDTPALRDVAMLYAKYDALYKAQPDPLQRLTDVQQEIETALTQPERKQVAGVVIREGLPTLLQDKHIKSTDQRLYTAPQQRKPLTDEEKLIDLLEAARETFKKSPSGSECSQNAAYVHSVLETMLIKREWQGLTENEMKKLADTHLKYQLESYEVSGVFDLLRAVSEKLKEKNT